MMSYTQTRLGLTACLGWHQGVELQSSLTLGATTAGVVIDVGLAARNGRADSCSWVVGRRTSPSGMAGLLGWAAEQFDCVVRITLRQKKCCVCAMLVHRLSYNNTIAIVHMISYSTNTTIAKAYTCTEPS
jgi:hypothetical protein